MSKEAVNEELSMPRKGYYQKETTKRQLQKPTPANLTRLKYALKVTEIQWIHPIVFDTLYKMAVFGKKTSRIVIKDSQEYSTGQILEQLTMLGIPHMPVRGYQDEILLQPTEEQLKRLDKVVKNRVRTHTRLLGIPLYLDD